MSFQTGPVRQRETVWCGGLWGRGSIHPYTNAAYLRIPPRNWLHVHMTEPIDLKQGEYNFISTEKSNVSHLLYWSCSKTIIPLTSKFYNSYSNYATKTKKFLKQVKLSLSVCLCFDLEGRAIFFPYRLLQLHLSKYPKDKNACVSLQPHINMSNATKGNHKYIPLLLKHYLTVLSGQWCKSLV